MDEKQWRRKKTTGNCVTMTRYRGWAPTKKKNEAFYLSSLQQCTSLKSQGEILCYYKLTLITVLHQYETKANTHAPLLIVSTHFWQSKQTHPPTIASKSNHFLLFQDNHDHHLSDPWCLNIKYKKKNLNETEFTAAVSVCVCAYKIWWR